MRAHAGRHRGLGPSAAEGKAGVLAIATSAVLAVAFALPGAVFDIYFPDGSMLAVTRDPASGLRPRARGLGSGGADRGHPYASPDARQGYIYPSLLGDNLRFTNASAAC